MFFRAQDLLSKFSKTQKAKQPCLPSAMPILHMIITATMFIHFIFIVHTSILTCIQRPIKIRLSNIQKTTQAKNPGYVDCMLNCLKLSKVSANQHQTVYVENPRKSTTKYTKNREMNEMTLMLRSYTIFNCISICKKN